MWIEEGLESKRAIVKKEQVRKKQRKLFKKIRKKGPLFRAFLSRQ